MSKNVKVVLNSAGIQELLKSKEVEIFLEDQAERMSAIAGVKYYPDTVTGKTRAVTRADVGNSRLGQEIQPDTRSKTKTSKLFSKKTKVKGYKKKK